MLRPVNKHKIQWLKDSGFKTTQTNLKFLGEKINNIFLKSDLVLDNMSQLCMHEMDWPVNEWIHMI